MKKILSLLVISPIVCLALGYGIGEYLNKSSHEDASITADPAHSSETHEPNEASSHETSDDTHADNTPHSNYTNPIVVKLGQMIVPVYKARSITYIVTELGVTVSDLKSAEYYNLGENGARLRDAIFTQLKHSAEGRALRGVSIDTEKLSHDITAGVQPNFTGIHDVLFLNFYKKDIARS